MPMMTQVRRPIFFLLYINDLPENMKCSMKLFADDASLFTIVRDPDQAAILLNHDLRAIEVL